MKLYLDTETFSTVPLADGLHNYVKGVEVMLVQYALDDGPETVWDRTAGAPMPSDLEDAIYDDRVPLVIANSQFDRTVLNATETFPGLALAPERICDTMLQAYLHGLPGALDKLCMIFGLTEEQAKIKEGRSLIHFFCKPNGGKRAYAKDHPERWARFVDYARRDITSMRIVHNKLPLWNYPGPKFEAGEWSEEHQLWCLDQRINDRGFAIDRALAQAAVVAELDEKKYLNSRTSQLTDGEVEAATQRDKLLVHLLDAHGLTLPDMRADTLQRRIDDPDLPLPLRQLLDLRLQSSRNSAAKYKAVLKHAGSDDRLRHTMQFAGAATTGRDSGRVFQPQNLMRPTMKQKAIDTAIEDVKSGMSTMLYDNLPEVLGNCVRGVIVAPPGRKLVVSDLSAIEGRMLAWLAGDEPILKFYRDYDAGKVKYDSYMLAYAQVFGGDPARATKGERTIGKPIELAFGYGGGVAAFLTFAATYHLDLDAMAERVWATGARVELDDCVQMYAWAKERKLHAGMGERKYAAFEYVKRKWRANRKPTVALWGALAAGFTAATAYEGCTFGDTIKFLRTGHWLRMRLPSGRQLCFLQPRVEGRQLSYMGLDRYTRKWSRVLTHGGKLSGIATQASARDLLIKGALPEAERQGYLPVLRVHDELVTETPDEAGFTPDGLNAILTRDLPWTTGLPLAAAGFEATRYRKD